MNTRTKLAIWGCALSAVVAFVGSFLSGCGGDPPQWETRGFSSKAECYAQHTGNYEWWCD